MSTICDKYLILTSVLQSVTISGMSAIFDETIWSGWIWNDGEDQIVTQCNVMQCLSMSHNQALTGTRLQKCSVHMHNGGLEKHFLHCSAGSGGVVEDSSLLVSKRGEAEICK